MVMSSPASTLTLKWEDIPPSARLLRESFGQDGFSGILAGVLASGVD